MIVIGVDPHKQTHTAAAIDRQTGELLGELTVRGNEEGHARLLEWARELGGERSFALEDCRQVSCRLERFLIGRGEPVVRVPPKLMAGARRAARSRGKSDAIDALAVARAAIREPDLPAAQLAGASRELRLLVDHREDLVCERTRIQNRLRWHLHEIDPELEPSRRSLGTLKVLERLGRRLARREQSVQVRVARELPGCGALTAAKLVGEVAASSASAPTPSSRCTPASPRSTSPPAASSATGSTEPATANSTAPSTRSPSSRNASTPPPRPTSPATKPTARPTRRRSEHSNASSPAASSTSST